MSVKACGKIGCNNIMCRKYIHLRNPKYAFSGEYICDICYDKLKTFLLIRFGCKQDINRAEIISAINDFMNSEKIDCYIDKDAHALNVLKGLMKNDEHEWNENLYNCKK